MAEPTTPKEILILGGSYGGLSTAHYLLKHAIPSLPSKESYRLTLISASSQVLCRPACPRALISDTMFAQEKLFVDIPPLFTQYPAENFRFIHGTATELDTTARTVAVKLESESGGENQVEKITFHALVIATGASTPSPLMGLNHTSQSLRKSWVEFREALPTAKTIIISGGGPAGIETAGELGEYLNGRAGWFTSKLSNPKVAITVITAGSEILPALRPSIAQTAEKYLAKVGVEVSKNTRVVSVVPAEAGSETGVASKATVTLDNGKTVEADLYIPCTGTSPNTSFVPKELVVADGRIETNTTTLRVDHAGPRVYALGDVSSSAHPAIHVLFPAIPILCANVKKDLLLAAGKEESEVGEDRVFKEDKSETQIVPIGKSRGVGAAMGWRLPSWMIWAIKGRDYWLWTTGNLWSGKQWAKEE